MKIEKLTDNKIRVIINSDELGLNHANVHHIMAKAIETQEIFSDILKKAEKEVAFYTDGCKLLIEAFSSFDDVIVFTITKYLPEKNSKKKKLIAKRKHFDSSSGQLICSFENFDTFCECCHAINTLHKLNFKKLAKNTILYLWKDTYYLVLKQLDTQQDSIDLLYAILSEFGKFPSSSNHFECKLLEHGKVMIKKNAIDIGMKYF